LDALKLIETKLPFLVDLTVEERKALPKLGDKSRGFVERASELSAQASDFLPRSFDVDELRKDAALFTTLFTIRQAVMILLDKIEDTYYLAGSEAYSAALVVYQFAKNSPVGTEGLDSVVDELGKRFARKSKGKPDA